MPEENPVEEEKKEETEKPAPTPTREGREEKKEKKEKERKRKIKGKKPHKNKPTSQRWKKYTIEARKLIREKTCPRCGPGIFLMKAKNRLYCGKCSYTVFTKKKEEKQEKKE